MFPFIARFVAVMVAGRVVARLARHRRVAPLTRSRKGRFALRALGIGLRLHPRTRGVGRVVRMVRQATR
jgi:hypothetical protein